MSQILTNTDFLDSGSFTLKKRAAQFAKATGHGEWEFYQTDEFFLYLDRYAEFIKKYHYAIDIAASVDVLPYSSDRKPPKGKDSHSLSYLHLKMLEDRGVRTLPVVHNRANLKWLRRYIEEGYQMVALGGVAGSVTDYTTKRWVRKCWDLICQDSGKPCIKVHGFGVTALDYIFKYPWFSVDSTTWSAAAAFGRILVPKFRRGRFIFGPSDLREAGLPTQNWVQDCQPFPLIMSSESEERKRHGALHYDVLTNADKRLVRRWLEFIGLPMGSVTKGTDGVTTVMDYRRCANMMYFEHLRKRLRPHAEVRWHGVEGVQGFGLNAKEAPLVIPAERRPFYLPELRDERMFLFLGGGGPFAKCGDYAPADAWKTDVLFNYIDMHKNNKPDKKYRNFVRARRARRKAQRQLGVYRETEICE